MLSGCFFTLASLPASLQTVIGLNPVYHAINGFRYGLTGFDQGSLLWGGLGLSLLCLAVGLFVWRLFVSGYKIKA